MATGWIREARRRQARAFYNSALEYRGLAQQAQQTYGVWLARLPWDLFVTLTLTLGQRESGYYLARRFSHWLREVQHLAGGREPRAVLAIEAQERGTYHGHALVYAWGRSREHAARDRLERRWLELGGGWAAVREYISAGGAADYVVKCVAKDGELTLYGPWSSDPACDVHSGL